jgi:hypothetical protein
MEYTLLMLLAPGPASGAQIEEAIARGSSVPLFPRRIASTCRDEAAGVLLPSDAAAVPGALAALEEGGMVTREGDTYALTEAGRDRVFGWSRALWHLVD